MNYLIFKLGAFGDITFALPLVRQIHEYDPAAEIHWAVDQNYSSFLEKFDGLTSIIRIDSHVLYQGSMVQKAKAVLDLRRSLDRYDAIFLLHRNVSFLFALAMKGEIYRITRKPLIGRGSKDVMVPPTQLHESLAYEKVWKAFLSRQKKSRSRNHQDGAPKKQSPWFTPPRLCPTPTSSPLNLTRDRRYAALHIGGGDNKKTQFNSKKWPHFRALIELILENTPRTILLIGTQSEYEALEPLPVSDRLISLCGKTSLTDLIDVAPALDCFVGPDSGPLHLFDLFGVHCIGLYGPTSEISWGVLGPKSKALVDSQTTCRPCYLDDGKFPPCKHNHECMSRITPEHVFAHI